MAVEDIIKMMDIFYDEEDELLDIFPKKTKLADWLNLSLLIHSKNISDSLSLAFLSGRDSNRLTYVFTNFHKVNILAKETTENKLFGKNPCLQFFRNCQCKTQNIFGYYDTTT